MPNAEMLGFELQRSQPHMFAFCALFSYSAVRIRHSAFSIDSPVKPEELPHLPDSCGKRAAVY
jgi:hypothetical protein